MGDTDELEKTLALLDHLRLPTVLLLLLLLLGLLLGLLLLLLLIQIDKNKYEIRQIYYIYISHNYFTTTMIEHIHTYK